MAGNRYTTNRYSVYETGTDRPLMIWGSAERCAAALGVDVRTFYTYIMRTRKGRGPKKYEIIIHTEKEEDVLL